MQQQRKKVKKYKIGQYFSGVYPPDAAIWCNNNHAIIVKLWTNQYQIQTVKEAFYDRDIHRDNNIAARAEHSFFSTDVYGKTQEVK